MSDEHRRTSRRSSLYAVTVDTGMRQIVAKVRDHSEHGCRLTLDKPPWPDEQEIHLVKGELRESGTIVWREGSNVGISLARAAPAGLFGTPPKNEPDKDLVVRREEPGSMRRPGFSRPGLRHVNRSYGRLWCTGQHD